MTLKPAKYMRFKMCPDYTEIYRFRDALLRVKKSGTVCYKKQKYTVSKQLAGKEIVVLEKHDGTLWAKRLEDEETELFPLNHIH